LVPRSAADQGRNVELLAAIKRTTRPGVQYQTPRTRTANQGRVERLFT